MSQPVFRLIPVEQLSALKCTGPSIKRSAPSMRILNFGSSFPPGICLGYSHVDLHGHVNTISVRSMVINMARRHGGERRPRRPAAASWLRQRNLTARSYAEEIAPYQLWTAPE